MRPHRWQPTRLPRPWDSPGKNTGVGCHFHLQCMKVKSESEVAQLCPTPSDPMDCSPPGPSVHGIFQARVLKWVAIDFSEWFFWGVGKKESLCVCVCVCVCVCWGCWRVWQESVTLVIRHLLPLVAWRIKLEPSACGFGFWMGVCVCMCIAVMVLNPAAIWIFCRCFKKQRWLVTESLCCTSVTNTAL